MTERQETRSSLTRILLGLLSIVLFLLQMIESPNGRPWWLDLLMGLCLGTGVACLLTGVTTLVLIKRSTDKD